MFARLLTMVPGSVRGAPGAGTASKKEFQFSSTARAFLSKWSDRPICGLFPRHKPNTVLMRATCRRGLEQICGFFKTFVNYRYPHLQQISVSQ